MLRSLTVVLAAKGYPGSYAKGSPITGLEGVTGAKVFHAGTALKDGQVVSDGRAGRGWGQGMGRGWGSRGVGEAGGDPGVIGAIIQLLIGGDSGSRRDST